MVSIRLFVLAALVAAASASVYSRCEIVQVLRANGIVSLADWTCLVEHESGGNTGAVGGPNFDGSYDYGFFQINDQFWCRNGYAGGDCNIACESLIDENLTDDIACAKIIYARHGFSAWYGWLNNCQGSLPDISGC